MFSVLNRIVVMVFLLSISLAGFSQEKAGNIAAAGYISSMQSALIEEFDDDWIVDNLIHNRLNFKLFAGSKVTFALEVRNRVFTGDMLKISPDYSERMAMDRGWLDMTWNIVDQRSILLNTTLDRLWVDVAGEKYQFTLGRQRINWGQTYIWNPNDIFNAYSYFDFDYSEKPGSDAVRLQLYPTYSSTIELAAKIDSEDNLTAAALYRFNTGGYDIQFLGGYVSGSDFVIGTGWSGAFGSTSFRGEISWFQPQVNFSDTTGTGLFTIGLDRSFSNNANLQFQAMYCNKPLDLTDFDSFYTGNLSAKDLAFSKVSLFAAAQIPITPLFNVGLSAILYPGIDGFFAGPTIDASLSENVDFSFFWQYFNADLDTETIDLNLIFLRVKYSF